MAVIEKLKTGDFNVMNQDWQPDGTVVITLTKRCDSRIYKMQVKDLYGENEEVLWESIDQGTGHTL